MIEYFKGVKKEISRIRWTSKKDLLKYSEEYHKYNCRYRVFK